jgi:hypothetical protein
VRRGLESRPVPRAFIRELQRMRPDALVIPDPVSGTLKDIAGGYAVSISGTPSRFVRSPVEGAGAFRYPTSADYATIVNFPKPSTSILALALVATDDATAAIRTWIGRSGGAADNSWALNLAAAGSINQGLSLQAGGATCASASTGGGVFGRDGRFALAALYIEDNVRVDTYLFAEQATFNTSSSFTGSWNKTPAADVTIGCYRAGVQPALGSVGLVALWNDKHAQWPSVRALIGELRALWRLSGAWS